jgi:hypothetical protein
LGLAAKLDTTSFERDLGLTTQSDLTAFDIENKKKTTLPTIFFD